MKKLLIFILLPFACFAQKVPDLGMSRVRLVETDKTILAEIFPVSKNTNAKSDKIYYWYGSNMIHSTQGGYSGKLLNGSYVEYYLNKNLKEQGIYKRGLKDGIWKSWNNSGILMQELTWKNGVLWGFFKTYNEDGKLKQRGSYHNNFLQGEVVNYTDKDSGTVTYFNHGKAVQKPRSFWSKLMFFRKKK